MARQDEVLVDGHVRQGGKGIAECSLILWLCNWGRALIRPLLHTRGRLCRRQANIKYIDKRSFYCMKKCRVLRLHNWCSVFRGVWPGGAAQNINVPACAGERAKLRAGFSPVYCLASQIWAALWFMRESEGTWEQTHPWTLVESVKNSWHVRGKEAWQLWSFCALKSI